MINNPTIPPTIPPIAPPERPLEGEDDDCVGEVVWEVPLIGTAEEIDDVVGVELNEVGEVVAEVKGNAGKTDVNEGLIVVLVRCLADVDVDVAVAAVEDVGGKVKVTRPVAWTPQSWPTSITSYARVEFNGNKQFAHAATPDVPCVVKIWQSHSTLSPQDSAWVIQEHSLVQSSTCRATNLGAKSPKGPILWPANLSGKPKTTVTTPDDRNRFTRR
jgi:hypothetical protein